DRLASRRAAARARAATEALAATRAQPCCGKTSRVQDAARNRVQPATTRRDPQHGYALHRVSPVENTSTWQRRCETAAWPDRATGRACRQTRDRSTSATACPLRGAKTHCRYVHRRAP